MSTAEQAGRQAQTMARRAADHPALDRLARVGLACRGVLYALIGVLAVQIALGGGSKEQADKGGAIAAVADLPFGEVILWIMVVGFAALALWQATEALFGGLKTADRAEAAVRTGVYVLVFVTLLTMLLSGKATSDDEKSQDVTAKLLELPGGQLIVGVVGLAVIGVGVYWIHSGIKKKFLEELNLGQMSPRARSVMERLGMAGYIARGAIAGLAGIFVVQAAITYDPDKAGGMDHALRAFADTPLGPWLLVLIALGLVLFAGYCFGESRWRRT